MALAPDMAYDAGGCFSGSAVETEEGHVLVYTGVREGAQEDGTKKTIQHQCLAVGDGVCYHKIKENPVISSELLPEGYSREDFRDPKIWEEDGTYYLVAGNRNQKHQGQVVLFSSEDLREWNYLSVLADNRGKYGKMWECPDFFLLNGKYCLIVSPMDMMADGKEFHCGNQSMIMIGEYDRENCQLEEEQVLSLDYGTDFYAPQTLEMPDGRRIMIAWMHSWDMDIEPAGQKWNGMMTVPRQLEIRGGIFYQNPVKELERYRTEPVLCNGVEICGECELPGVRGRVLDLTLHVLEGEYETFSVYFAKNDAYATCFRYDRGAQTISFDRTFSGMVRDAVCQRSVKIKNPQETLKLRLILDKYSVELFINDGVQAFSSTFYTPLEAEEIVLESDGRALLNVEKYNLDGVTKC